MARKSLEKQIAELKFDAKIYAANQRRLVRAAEPMLQHLTKDQITTLYHVSEGFKMIGLSINDGVQLCMRNRLPQALQDHYLKMSQHPFPGTAETKADTETETETDKDMESSAHEPPLETSLDERYPRWRPDHWRCSCGELKTLWFKTQFAFKDRNQIYCASCRTLAGWGSDHAFKGAQAKGEATRTQITHPLDREAFKPPLMSQSPKAQSQNPVRAKQSQRRTRSQDSFRAKRTQPRGSSS